LQRRLPSAPGASQPAGLCLACSLAGCVCWLPERMVCTPCWGWSCGALLSRGCRQRQPHRPSLHIHQRACEAPQARVRHGRTFRCTTAAMKGAFAIAQVSRVGRGRGRHAPPPCSKDAAAPGPAGTNSHRAGRSLQPLRRALCAVLCAGHLAHRPSFGSIAAVGSWLRSCALSALPAVRAVRGSNGGHARRVSAATLQPLHCTERVRWAASRRRRPRCAGGAGRFQPSLCPAGRAGRRPTLGRRARAGRAGRAAGRGAARARAAAPARPWLPRLCGEPVQGRRGGGQRVLQGAGGHRADRRAPPPAAPRARRPPPARRPAVLGASLGLRWELHLGRGQRRARLLAWQLRARAARLTGAAARSGVRGEHAGGVRAARRRLVQRDDRADLQRGRVQAGPARVLRRRDLPGQGLHGHARSGPARQTCLLGCRPRL